MAKKPGFKPFILMDSGTPGDEVVIGGGSGQGGSDPIPMSYNEWVASAWATDYNDDGEYTWEEFSWWWEDSGFTMDQWDEYNPDHPWEAEWDPLP